MIQLEEHRTSRQSVADFYPLKPCILTGRTAERIFAILNREAPVPGPIANSAADEGHQSRLKFRRVGRLDSQKMARTLRKNESFFTPWAPISNRKWPRIDVIENKRLNHV
jgi:hypothetical protein